MLNIHELGRSAADAAAMSMPVVRGSSKQVESFFLGYESPMGVTAGCGGWQSRRVLGPDAVITNEHTLQPDAWK